ncbi:porin family protein [Ketobacter sp.]|uniref:porin family protein n=1 Tax=Ketobacter sp. TaxID=2083498 RepID=UPI000F0F65C2|nr:porin family protein [Ketobacter sp.]RLT96033.1 MAG: porin family protein [Ketobacter sp.]
MKYLTHLSIVTALLIPAPLVSASNDDDSGLYVGGNYGYLKVKDDDDFDDDNDAYQLIIGGDFNAFIGVEGSYIDFGKYGGNVASADTDGYTLALKGTLPLTDFFSLHAKGGQLWWNSDYEVVGFDGSADGDELFWGVGAAFAVTQNVEITFDYTRYNVEFSEDEVGLLATDSIDSDVDLDHAAAGVRFKF